MSYHGPYTNRATSRHRSYTGLPVRAGQRNTWALIATIVAIAVTGAAIGYDLSQVAEITRKIAPGTTTPVNAPTR